MATEVASLAIPPVVTEWFCLPVLAMLDSSGLEGQQDAVKSGEGCARGREQHAQNSRDGEEG